MGIAGLYQWKGNNSYGDNHRRLRIVPNDRETFDFEWVVVSSAGPQGSAGSTIRGRVGRIDDRRLTLVGETEESWVHDDQPWEQTRPSTARLALIVRTPDRLELDGQRYDREKEA